MQAGPGALLHVPGRPDQPGLGGLLLLDCFCICGFSKYLCFTTCLLGLPSMQDGLEFSFTYLEGVISLGSGAFCVWYYLKKHWLANNMLGLGFSLQGIEHLSLGAVMNGVILLSGG
jgi:hypothetical protein